MWDSIKSAIGSIAPWLATTLGGPLAGTAVSKLTEVLGLTNPQKQDADSILNAIQNATPDQILAIRKADQEHQQFMAQLQVNSLTQLEQLAGQDRANARAREIATKDNTPRFLAYGITFGFFAVLGVFAFMPIPQSGQAVLNIMIGALGTSFGGIVGYYFGSSSGSDRKTELLAAAPAVDTSKGGQ